MTHDYKRNGTTTLFAALNVLDGQVIGQCQQRHKHVEWLKFLRQIDRQTPKDKTLHLICDNYATHKHPTVQAWLDQERARYPAKSHPSEQALKFQKECNTTLAPKNFLDFYPCTSTLKFRSSSGASAWIHES
jgi:hypothetical protein